MIDKVLNSNFEFPKAEERQNGGNRNIETSTQTLIPKTRKEFDSFILDTRVPLEQRNKVNDAVNSGQLVLKD